MGLVWCSYESRQNAGASLRRKRVIVGHAMPNQSITRSRCQKTETTKASLSYAFKVESLKKASEKRDRLTPIEVLKVMKKALQKKKAVAVVV